MQDLIHSYMQKCVKTKTQLRSHDLHIIFPPSRSLCQSTELEAMRPVPHLIAPSSGYQRMVSVRGNFSRRLASVHRDVLLPLPSTRERYSLPKCSCPFPSQQAQEPAAGKPQLLPLRCLRRPAKSRPGPRRPRGGLP